MRIACSRVCALRGFPPFGDGMRTIKRGTGIEICRSDDIKAGMDSQASGIETARRAGHAAAPECQKHQNRDRDAGSHRN